MTDVIYVREKAKSVKKAPKYEPIDMVVLYLDSKTFVSSPYVLIDKDEWEESALGGVNGEYTFEYDEILDGWAIDGNEAVLSEYGITSHFAQNTPQPKKPEAKISEFKNDAEQKPRDPIAELDLSFLDQAEMLQSSQSVADPADSFDIFSKRAIRSAKREEEFSRTESPHTEPVIINDRLNKAEEKTELEPENTERPEKTETEKSPEESRQPMLFSPPENELRYIGELFNTYILVEHNKSELMLIDKHAAHERIIYEKLKAEKAGASSQYFLQPVTVTLGKDEYNAAVNNLNMFSDCGFEVEDFGNSTVIVRSAPQYIDAAEISDCIAEMADHIAMGKNDVYSEKMDWFYHNVACRSAIKAGNKNTAQELIDIVNTLRDNPDIRYCPHGRPITIIMKKSEIERQFGRV